MNLVNPFWLNYGEEGYDNIESIKSIHPFNPDFSSTLKTKPFFLLLFWFSFPIIVTKWLIKINYHLSNVMLMLWSYGAYI